MAAIITPPFSAPQTFGSPALLAALGDSITFYSLLGAFTVNQICYASQGFMTWAVVCSGGAVECPLVVEVGSTTPLVNYNRAVAGETAEECRARVREIDALPVKPRFCNVLIGTNNLTRNISQPASSVAQTIVGICEDLLARQITPILFSLLPRGNGTVAGWGAFTPAQILTARGKLLEINDRLRVYAKSRAGVIFFDAFAVLVNYASATSDATAAWQPDFIHTNAPGAIRLGQYWWLTVKNSMPPAPEYYFGEGDLYNAVDTPFGSMVNASYSAGGGTAGAGVAGTVPATMTINRLAGTGGTVNVTQRARLDGVNGFEMVLDMTGAVDNTQFRAFQGTSIIPTANFLPGQAYYALQDFVFDGTGANQYGNPDLTFRMNAAPVQIFAALNSGGSQGDFQGTLSGRLRTPYVVVPSGGLAPFENSWSIDGIRPGGVASVIRRPHIWKRYPKGAPGALTW